nr:MAG TPA: hypothetical protein [Caudoviricetes sp.]
MDFSSLKRDKNKILDAIYVDPAGSMIAKRPLKIVVPASYEERHLASVEDSIYTLGIFAFIVDGYYAVNVMAAKVRLFPTEYEKVKYEEASYYLLTFDKGATITDNINLVKDNTIGYYIYNCFVALGKVPWFMNAVDMATLFETTLEYSGVSYGASHVATELISSMIMRDPNDIMQYWRHGVKTIDEVNTRKPAFIPLRNVPFGARNTTSKLMGAYFNEGLVSALMYPSEQTDQVEALLRQ